MNDSTILPYQNDRCQNDRLGSARWPYPKIVLHALLITVAIVGTLLAWQVLCRSGGDLGWMLNENGALENTQATILVLAVFGGLLAFFRTGSSHWRTIAIAIACIALAGWSREIQSTQSAELSSSSFSDSQSVGFTLDRTFKHSLILLAGVVMVARAIFAWVRHPEDRKLWFSPRFIWPAIPFFACFVTAEICEELHLVVIEEAVEILAYMMLLLCSGWIIRSSQSNRDQAKPGNDVDVQEPERIKAA